MRGTFRKTQSNGSRQSHPALGRAWVLQRRVPRGFTLVELLVVMALIALMVAMLLPSVSLARTAAKRVRCAGNFRQVATAFTSYSNDNRGYLTGMMKTGMTGSSAFAVYKVGAKPFVINHGVLYPDYMTSPEPFFCPDYDYESTDTTVNLADVRRSAKDFVKNFDNGTAVTTMQMPCIQWTGADQAPANDIYVTRAAKPSGCAISARLDDNYKPSITPIAMDSQMWRFVYKYWYLYGGAHDGEHAHVLYADMAIKFVDYPWRELELAEWHMGGTGPLASSATWTALIKGRNNP